jgi:hypothetical protein
MVLHVLDSVLIYSFDLDTSIGILEYTFRLYTCIILNYFLQRVFYGRQHLQQLQQQPQHYPQQLPKQVCYFYSISSVHGVI